MFQLMDIYFSLIIHFLLQKNWILGKDNYYTFGVEEKKTEEALPALELTEQVLEYARELEMIV